MAERDGIFAGDDPFDIARRWLSEAEAVELNDPNAMALATVDGQGMPDVRVVLLKGVDGTTADGSFVFYTNQESAKGCQIAETGVAAFVLHWKTLRRQIRVRGDVSVVESTEADAYYTSRALESRIGAWASAQSRPLASREALISEVARQSDIHGLNPSRPAYWGGYRIHPRQIEFWADGAFRLHDRFRWVRTANGPINKENLPDRLKSAGCLWQIQRLNP